MDISKLPRDITGTPIPAAVGRRQTTEGWVADFNNTSEQRLAKILSRRGCQVCGKRIIGSAFFVVTFVVDEEEDDETPYYLSEDVWQTQHAPGHRECLEAAMKLCPVLSGRDDRLSRKLEPGWGYHLVLVEVPRWSRIAKKIKGYTVDVFELEDVIDWEVLRISMNRG
jgi:hypothetical protein